MRITRIYYPIQLENKQEISLDAGVSHRLLRVLRLQQNDFIIIFNENNGAYKAKIISTQKEKVKILLEDSSPSIKEPPITINLAQALLRNEKMDFVIQKATELGVKSITPIATEHCNLILNAERQERRLQHWQEVAISASEQSGRCSVPQISNLQSLQNYLTNSKEELKLVLAPEAPFSLNTLIQQQKIPPKTLTFLVGPEGGLSSNEINLMKQQGFVPVTLGKRILRTETASLVALSIIQSAWGDLN
ncbi:MAG: 16S rRNA (uracil(1498)-N(3))-methyltransferase [Gammaproteobacteria bacterium]